MKKFLLSMIAVLGMSTVASAATVTFPATKVGDWTEYTWTQSGDDFTANVGGYTFTLVKNTSGNALLAPDAYSIRLYAGAKLTITAPDGTLMTQVEGLTASNNKAVGTSVQGSWTNETGKITAAANQPFKFTATTGQSSITFDGNGKQLRIKSITITYTSGTASNKDAANLKFPKSSYTATMGKAFTAPVLSKDTDAPATYTSSNEAVAKVDAATGAVTLVAAGETTITAATAETEDFEAGNASYKLTVNPPVATKTVTLVSALESGKYAFVCEKGVMKNYSGSNANYGYVYLDTEIVPTGNSFECPEPYLVTLENVAGKGYTIKGTNGKFWGMDASHAGSFNFYDDADASGSNCYWDIALDGTTAKISNKGRAGYFLGYKEYNTSWEIVTTNAATDPSAFKLYKSSDVVLPEVAEPTFNPASGAVEKGTKVAIACATEGAKVYYTLDSTEPTEASTLYTAPIEVNDALTIKAVAMKEGMNNSPVVSASYVIKSTAVTTAATFNFTDPSTLTPAYTLDQAEDDGTTGNKKIDVNDVTFTANAISLVNSGTGTAARLYYQPKTPAWSYRIYKSSVLTVSCPATSKLVSIVFDTQTSSYATDLGNATFSTGAYDKDSKTLYLPEGTTKVTITPAATIGFNGITVNFSDASAVEAIEAEDADAPVVYYNLQGVRVANPENGLYIRVQGNKATKVLVK